MGSGPVKNIIIVGGGAAGWLTAGVIAADHRATSPDGLRVTLIESPDVKTLGVGEGTWPSMRDTLRRIGLSETDLVRECDAAFKQGSKFCRWRRDDSADAYYHPFMAPLGWGEFDASSLWQEHYHDSPFASIVSPQPHICDQGLAPKQAATPEFAAVANYAYHLDAGKFGELLKKHCHDRLGVHHVIDHVERVVPGANDEIAAVATREHGEIRGDLFIDCTGFKALLIGGHLNVRFVDRKAQLFNDSALAIQVPHASPDTPIASATISTAHSAGWIWDIGLPTRRGIGVVYSSDHTDTDAARQTLRSYLQAHPQLAETDIAAARTITFQPGHREQFWKGNCVAVGVSAGFIEPLEASALALIELSAAMISDEMPATRESMDVVARRFNERFTYRWERIMEFLKLHYVLSDRAEPYWQDHRETSTIPAAEKADRGYKTRVLLRRIPSSPNREQPSKCSWWRD